MAGPEWDAFYRLSFFRRVVAALPAPPARIADLGPLDGKYAAGLGAAGYDVLGIEGQQENYEQCLGVANERCQFVLDDVRNLDKHGPFDAIFCGGVLYHLDQPRAFLKLCRRMTAHLVLNTHYAQTESNPYGCSEMTENEGLPGRWFQEGVGPASSVGNARSFWIAKAALLTELERLWGNVREDPSVADDEPGYVVRHDRSLFIAHV
jgi:SAM-dependent methyltransferase